MNEAAKRKAEKIATKRIVHNRKRTMKMSHIGKCKKKNPPTPSNSYSHLCSVFRKFISRRFTKNE